MEHGRARRGAALTLLGGILWGFSGTCGQFLLQRRGLTSEFIVPIRLMSAGLILLVICLLGCGMLEPYLFVAENNQHYLSILFLAGIGYLHQWTAEKE